ncbi:hypothetical protein [Halioxenophilus sp. WMMB6]|uniref:hypothetical protein n=1 Tax=Halioxenophilus sp. WMMB6 TaxID=3073815 RepID=UPI00295E6BD0|nr:hypothetical protein [Halioxenophilus sp. WMMB6]
MKILYLESRELYRRFGLNESGEIFDGALSLSLGLLSLSDFDVVVSTLYHSHSNIKWVQRARQCGVYTVLLVDGIYEWANCFENPFTKKRKIYLLDPIYHDLVFLCASSQVVGYLSLCGEDVRHMLNKSVIDRVKSDSPITAAKVDFLVATANTPYFDTYEKERLVSLLREVRLALECSGFSYLCRIPDEELRRLAGFSEESLALCGSFTEVVQECSALISTPSSVCMQAMALGKPVAQMCYRDVPMSFQTGWLIFGGSAMSETLKKMISYDDSPQRMEYQASVVREHMMGPETPEMLESAIKDAVLRRHTPQFYEPTLVDRCDFLWRPLYERFIKGTKLSRFLRH